MVEVVGGVRTYAADGRDVLHPSDLDAVCDGAHGTPLVPWPNRIGDGSYTFDGVHQQLDLRAAGGAVRTIEKQMLALLTPTAQQRLLTDLAACAAALTGAARTGPNAHIISD